MIKFNLKEIKPDSIRKRCMAELGFPRCDICGRFVSIKPNRMNELESEFEYEDNSYYSVDSLAGVWHYIHKSCIIKGE